MPELPEVETIRRQLHAALAGRTITVVELWRSGRESPHGISFVQGVTGRRILTVERRAKLLVWRFDDGSAMVGHLKMTGKFLVVDNEYERAKHDRMRFVTDGPSFVWSDIRQFGYLRLFSNPRELEDTLSAYGPEPLQVEPEDLAARFMAPTSRKVKAALLDQATIAGVGNIYADEACHRAGIRPTRRLGTLTAANRVRLAREIQAVLAESIAQKGTSANDYVDTLGERGGFLDLLRVYGRDGDPCRSCGVPIRKIVLGGRGTHYCPSCQH